jgi:threonine/homoserine/homoserine lactone efflux protein
MLEATGLSSAHQLLLFMAAALVLNATPGVDLLLTVTRTLQGGARAGLAAAFGLATLLALSTAAFAAVKWAGAAYLLWLAAGMLRAAWRPGATAATAAPVAALGVGAHFRAGLVTNVLNPKVALFFLAFLPQFIGPGVAHKTGAFLALGAVFVVQGTLFLCIVVAAVARLRRLPSSPAAVRMLQTVGGLLFAGLALRLLAARQPVT